MILSETGHIVHTEKFHHISDPAGAERAIKAFGLDLERTLCDEFKVRVRREGDNIEMDVLAEGPISDFQMLIVRMACAGLAMYLHALGFVWAGGGSG